MDSDGFVILSYSIIMWVRGYLQVEIKSTNIRSGFRDEEILPLSKLSLHTIILSKHLTPYMQYSVLL